MSLSMYEASVPVLLRFLRNLSQFLDAAQTLAEQKQFDSAVLVRSRLAPDMLDLAKQVQIASDTAKGCAARLAGIAPPSFADSESSIAELKDRIARTIEFVQSVAPDAINGSEERQIVLTFPKLTLEFTGREYLLHFVLPNFLFHVSTAYGILRHNGVVLGKLDFLAR